MASGLDRLDIEGRWFTDSAGRRMILRGVNLGGDCKVPYPDGGTNFPSDFRDHRDVTFIGRPFPLAEAREHFARLSHWGFNALRLLTTWEAVEHKGPGQYDEDYLDYFAKLCALAGEHGFYVFIDFHQDAWSRMSGGDGAPGWTFESVGLDFTKFHAADAAHVMQYKYDYAKGGRQEDRYPQMTWSQNYQLPANAIMWTLFFGGRTFAPQMRVNGRNVQDYLQEHYLGAMREVARRIADQPHVMGFDTLNEPGTGWIGLPLGQGEQNPDPVRAGLLISPRDGMLAARGQTRMVPEVAYDKAVKRLVETRKVAFNPNGVSIWRDGASCPFADAERDEHFFSHRDGIAFDVEHDFMAPFFHRVAQTMRDIRNDWLLFAEVSPFRAFAGFPTAMPERTVNASHWYDIATLGLKRFDPRELRNAPSAQEGRRAVRDRFVAALSHFTHASETLGPHGAPTLIGEFGIPFDLNGGEAYTAWAAGDRTDKPWAQHELAQSLMYDAMDRLMISSTQWNYTATNRNDAAIGDGWNQEDLSIYSIDQNGGRAVKGFSRPFARRIQGEPRAVAFDTATAIFELRFDADPAIAAPTEIFVPPVHYPNGAKLAAEGCRAAWRGAIVELTAERPGPTIVTITPVTAPSTAAYTPVSAANLGH